MLIVYIISVVLSSLGMIVYRTQISKTFENQQLTKLAQSNVMLILPLIPVLNTILGIQFIIDILKSK